MLMRMVILVLPLLAQCVSAADIEGKVALNGGVNQYSIVVGYVGMTKKGQVLSMSSGATVGGKNVTETVTQPNNSEKKVDLNYSAQSGCQFRMAGLEPGLYLVYVDWRDQYLDWAWVFIKHDTALASTDLDLDPAKGGTFEILLPPSTPESPSVVQIMPMAYMNKKPFPLNPQVENVSVVHTDSQKIQVKGLREGSYTVLVEDGREKNIELKAGVVATVDLSQPLEKKAELAKPPVPPAVPAVPAKPAPAADPNVKSKCDQAEEPALRF